MEFVEVAGSIIRIIKGEIVVILLHGLVLVCFHLLFHGFQVSPQNIQFPNMEATIFNDDRAVSEHPTFLGVRLGYLDINKIVFEKVESIILL